MRITIKNPKTGRYYVASVSPAWARRHDNGALVSCGLTVGDSSLSAAAFKTLEKAGALREISREDYNHSGCQSGCIRRGDPKCIW